MSNNEMKVWIILLIAAAVVFIAMIAVSAYTDLPRQYGDKVCIKVGRELNCEPIEGG